jgi:hypothetical protein
MTLMTFEILAKADKQKRIYQWLFSAIFLNALGMLISFLIQGYAFYSVFFSTLFILTSYVFSYVFIKDIRKSAASKVVKLLAISSAVYLVLSSVGPFTLAYLLAHKSGNIILYKDAIYTYLHMQYNGFFTLAVFALLLNRVENDLPTLCMKKGLWFARLLNYSVIPSLFLCYLWHYPNDVVRTIAIIGTIAMLVTLVYFSMALITIKNKMKRVGALVRIPLLLSLSAFILKMLLQSLTIFKPIGDAVFNNRPVIIGFLHLVLLGFITLYLLAHFIHAGLLRHSKITYAAMIIFTGAILLNEAALLTQGLGVMAMHSSRIYPWALWLASIGLLCGAILLVFASYHKKQQPKQQPQSTLSPEFNDFLLNTKIYG